MTRVLALDIGSSSVRAQSFDEHGRSLDELRQAQYDGSDPEEIVGLVRRAVDGRESGADAIGISCFGHSLLGLDSRGRPVTPLFGWRDTRSAETADWLARRLDGAAVHARTGCHIHPSYWLAKLAWLGQANPSQARQAKAFVSIAEYVLMQLAGGTPRMSVSSASATGLLDLTTLDWDRELLDVLRLDEGRLPEISDEPVARWFPAWLDGACSNVGVGCVSRERAALMVGTSGALRIVFETEQPQPRLGLFLYRLDGRRVLEGGALSDGGNLHAWLARTLREDGGALAGRDPDAHGLTFLALLGGERSTGWNPFARGAIAGLTFETTPLDLRQAALEGVAYRFAEVAELLPEVEQVVATGGALRADPDWTQIMADVLARPVVSSAVEEGSLRGAAVLALERLGLEADEAPPGAAFHPREDRADAYRSARDRQRELYELMSRFDPQRQEQP